MARPRQPGLTENELDVMKILWEEAPLSVGEILERLKRQPKPAYTSLLTLIQAMTKKGYLFYRKVGKAHIYSPKMQRKSFVTDELVRMAKRLFDGSAGSLVMNLVEDEKLTDAEVRELRKLLEERA